MSQEIYLPTTSDRLVWPGRAPDTSTSLFRQEFEACQSLLSLQPEPVRVFIGEQGKRLAEAITQGLDGYEFELPDQVLCPACTAEIALEVPPRASRQAPHKTFWRRRASPITERLHCRLVDLELSGHEAVATSARLIRHATALHLVCQSLPEGEPVLYRPAPGEEVPSIPLNFDLHAAGQFYLPQWVAFDNQGDLLVSSLSQARALVALMEGYMESLRAAILLAPYMVAFETYQAKRYGMLGQLVNQGRALGFTQTRQIIQTIQKQAAVHKLNRGFHISLPYFDDGALAMRNYEFAIIPPGRVLFVPAFVVLAARHEQTQVCQNMSLTLSTRKHLLAELRLIERAFDNES